MIEFPWFESKGILMLALVERLDYDIVLAAGNLVIDICTIAVASTPFYRAMF